MFYHDELVKETTINQKVNNYLTCDKSKLFLMNMFWYSAIIIHRTLGVTNPSAIRKSRRKKGHKGNINNNNKKQKILAHITYILHE